MEQPLEQTSIMDDDSYGESDEYTYSPSEKEKEVLAKEFECFRNSADNRNQGFEYFDGRDLVTYIDDNVRRWFTTVDERDDIEDWQARVFDPFTRNKVIAILGKVSSAIPRAEFMPVGDEDTRRAQILGDMYEYADNVDDTEELMFFALLEASIKGTVVGYEGYEEKRKKNRDIKKYDSGDDLRVTESEKKFRKLFGAIVPLEDFYPSSVGIRKIKDMPYCHWRSIITKAEFDMVFSVYSKSQYVQAYHAPVGDDEERPFYLDYVSDDVGEGEVEIRRYYNQDDDEFIIVANGVWLNPIGENEDISPIPFNHKSLPFWKSIYEPLGADFFYGKPLPDKLRPMQDVLNVLHNMMLDQSFLSIFSPLLVGGMDEIDDDFLVPGRRISVTDVNNFKPLEMSTPNSFHTFILQYTKRVLEESSVDAVQQGIAGSGDRVTAREINEAAQGVASILGLFIQFVKWAVRDKARLRGKNILQFYSAPLIERIGGEGATEAFNKAFNTITLDDVVLTNGKRGTKIIELYSDRESMPTQMQLRTQAQLMSKESGKKIEKIAINSEYIRDFEFDVKLVPNSRTQENKALDRALFLEYSAFVINAFPDLVDRETLLAEATEKYGYRPDKFMVKQGQQQQQMQQQLGAGNGTTQNVINSQTGGRQGAMELRDMMRQ